MHKILYPKEVVQDNNYEIPEENPQIIVPNTYEKKSKYKKYNNLKYLINL